MVFIGLEHFSTGTMETEDSGSKLPLSRVPNVCRRVTDWSPEPGPLGTTAGSRDGAVGGGRAEAAPLLQDTDRQVLKEVVATRVHTIL